MDARRRHLAKHFNAFMEAGMPGLAKQGYNATGYMQLVHAQGSHYAAAKFLLDDPRHTTDGFQRLYAMNRLDASAEYAASLPWFQELFTPEQLYEARTRLITHEFPLDRALAEAAADPPAWLPYLEVLDGPGELGHLPAL
jgi:hypothetical protein